MKPWRDSLGRVLLACVSLAALASTSCTDVPAVIILTPAQGEFSTAPTTNVTGMVVNVDPADAAVLVNGVPVAVDGLGGFSTTVNLDSLIVFNGIGVQLTDTSNGFVTQARVTVIAGDSIADGSYSLQSVALRINDSGLDTLESIVADLVDFDPADLVPLGTVVLDECVVFDPLFGLCLGSARVTIVSPAPSASSFGISMDSMTNFVAADVLVTDLDIHLDIDGSGLVPNCPLDISASTTDIFGDYALDPDAIDPTTVDVNQLPGVTLVFGNFNYQLFGICDVPIIGDIIQLFLPDIETLFSDGFVDFLEDPDAGGPLDAPIADAIEVALLGIEISGPIGESLGVTLDTPMFDIPEDNDGLTIGTDTSVTASVGTGPGQCDAPITAPDLLASYHVVEPFPSFGPTTPSGTPYEIGICMSTSAFNQLLKAQIECGLLQLDLTEFDFGTGPVPLTTGLLALFIPQLGEFPPSSPVVLRLRPGLAPVLTGNAGPAGELAELRMGHLIMELRDVTPGVDEPLLVIAIDFRAGLELLIDDATDQLAPTVTSLDPGDVTVSLIENLIGTNEATLQQILPTLLAVALPQLGASLGAFPVPSFLDLELAPVEIDRNGQFMSIFANLTVPLLDNGNMEDDLDTPTDGLGWDGDLFSIVMAENGVSALNGTHMLRFDATTPSGAAAGPDAEVSQVIDLSAFAGQIATGTATLQTTAFFNRIDAGPNTDTEFQINVDALDGGASVIGSASQTISTDADVATWENHIAGLLLPAATASARVTLVASEDVLDDVVSPEFDGHYADNARAKMLEPLPIVNADMEDTLDTFNDATGWEGDPFTIVGAEMGVTPSGGSSMMRFDTTMPAGPSADKAVNVTQDVDVTEYASLIATGTATYNISAEVNRVDVDAETDTQFLYILSAKDAGGGGLGLVFLPFFSDANPATWETHSGSLPLPVGTVTVTTVIVSFENVFDDVVAPEFDGHYIDDLKVWVAP
jgi:hypothetical protein